MPIAGTVPYTDLTSLARALMAHKCAALRAFGVRHFTQIGTAGHWALEMLGLRPAARPQPKKILHTGKVAHFVHL
jgi:hypothetical protein